MRHLSPILRQTAARHPHKTALVYEGERATWAELDRRVERLAAGLLALGVQRGDCIGILCPTRPEYLEVYLAAMRAGAVLAGFNIHYTAREIREYAALVRPVMMFVTAEMGVAAQLAPILAAMSGLRHTIAIGRPAPPGWLTLEQVAQTGQSPELRAREGQLQEEDGALIVFTGGITGTPKGALLTHRNIVSNIQAQNANLGWQSEDRLILHLPMNHVSGATLLAAGAVLSGATLIMLDRFRPQRSLELVARERVTILGQVPAMWIMQFLLPDYERYDLASVRMTLVSGAPTSSETMRQIAAVAPVAIHAWGLTEAAGMVTYTAPGDDLQVLLHSAGRAAPEFEVAVRDDRGAMLEPGNVGEIVVRGDCVMAGYVGQPQETARQIDSAGWLRTGDLGRLDERGYLTLTGRSKRMYISGGYNVYPREIETYLLQHPAVAAVHCDAIPHSILGESGRVVITPARGHSLTPGEIKSYCKQGLARYKVPTVVRISEG